MTYPHDWQEKKLGECVRQKLSYGINAPAINYDGKNPAYIRITDITDEGKFSGQDRKSVATQEQEKYTLHHGDILLARTGASTGKTYLYDEKDGSLVYAGFLIKASIDVQKYDPRFIFGQLRTQKYWAWVAATSMRSGQPGINSKEYASFSISVPPLAEQKAIAETLATFDEYIDALAALIDKKKNIRNGALEDLMSGKTRLPGFCGDWEEKNLLDCVSLVQGLTYKPANVKSFGTLVLRSSNIKNNHLSLEDNVFVNSYVPDDKIIQDGDILVCVRNGSAALIGKSCVLKKMPNTTFGAFMSVLRGDSTGYIAKIFQSPIVQKQLTNRSSATINQITKKDFESVKIPVPPPEEQKAIAEILTALDAEIEALTAEREKIIALRAGAMDELLTGKIRLKLEA